MIGDLDIDKTTELQILQYRKWPQRGDFSAHPWLEWGGTALRWIDVLVRV